MVSSFATFKTLWSRVLGEVTCPIYTQLEKTASWALEALWGFLSSDAQMWLPVITRLLTLNAKIILLPLALLSEP